jgi:hypothetical protein
MERRDGKETIEITPAMIEAGLCAWKASAGDEYPVNSTTNDLTIIDIYTAMALADRRALSGAPS